MTRLEERIRSGLQETAERIPDTAPTHATSRHRSSRPAGVWVGVAAVIVVLVVFGGLALLTGGGDGVANDPVPTSSTTPAVSPFLGTWVNPQPGSTRTMVIQASEDESVEMLMHESSGYDYPVSQDAAASPCMGASTMTGTGRFDGHNELVFPSPVVTCDGSQPNGWDPNWTPLEEMLQNLTFTHDPGADTLTDNFESVWTREDADPPTTTLPLDTEITDLLNGFLEARIAGEGAGQYLNGSEEDIPLLYATTSGVPYDRGEFEPVLGIEWPYGSTAFKVRLFAGHTVVEQLFFFTPEDGLWYQWDGFATEIAPTTENGRPEASLPYDLFDGEVTLHFAHPWFSINGNPLRLIPEGVGPSTDGGQRNTWSTLSIKATAPMGPGCQLGPATAEGLADSIRSELDITAPVVVSSEALIIDVVNDPDATTVLQRICDLGVVRLILQSPGDSTRRIRLHLLDSPEGSSMPILAIALVAPESDFERAVEAAAPVIESVEFHVP